MGRSLTDCPSFTLPDVSARAAQRYPHAALEQVNKWRLLLRNPATGVELPKTSRREMRVMTPDEARCFLRCSRRSRSGCLKNHFDRELSLS